jgi:hypothetical protein
VGGGRKGTNTNMKVLGIYEYYCAVFCLYQLVIVQFVSRTFFRQNIKFFKENICVRDLYTHVKSSFMFHTQNGH